MSNVSKPVRDLLITAIETNHHHGVGVLLHRMFGRGEEFLCIRTTSQHEGREPFGAEHHELCSRFLTDAETERHLRAILELYQIRRILVVPYYREEFVHAVLAKRLTGAPLCTYLMDDQNVFDTAVPDARVAALLGASDLSFGISSELCAAYAAKFGHEIHLLPPLVAPPAYFVPNYWSPDSEPEHFCAMLGNVWTARRFEQLRALCRETNLKIHWYGNGPKASWLTGTPDEWAADGIEPMGFLPEDDLVAALASYPFVLLPSGSLDADDDNPAFSHLSLPSRLVFLHAHTDTPVIVLGHPETAAARFVLRLGSGTSAAYAADELRRAMADVTNPPVRTAMRRAVARAARHLTITNGGDWLWSALNERTPREEPFHALFPAVAELRATLGAARPAAAPDPRFARPRAFGVSQQAHFATVPTLAELPAGEAADLEISNYHAHVLAGLIRTECPPRPKVLFLGEWAPPVLQAVAREGDWWRIQDLAAWRAQGFSGDPLHLVRLDGSGDGHAGFPQFDAIISAGWLGFLPDEFHALEGFSLYSAACTRPGGWNFHAFNAVLHPSFAWAPPAHAYLRKRFSLPPEWPGLDDLLRAADPFFMSETAYERDWRASTGKSYRDFGRVFGLIAAWPKAGA